MGGTLEERGNTTETGEWNACVDPEAAEVVPAGRRDPPHLPARCDAGRRLHDGGPATRLPDTHLAGIVRDAVRFYVGFHREADGIDGAYLHDPVDAHRVAAATRPRDRDASTETLACDTQRRSVPGRQPVPLDEARPPTGPGRDRHRSRGDEGRAHRAPRPRRQRPVQLTPLAHRRRVQPMVVRWIAALVAFLVVACIGIVAAGNFATGIEPSRSSSTSEGADSFALILRDRRCVVAFVVYAVVEYLQTGSLRVDLRASSTRARSCSCRSRSRSTSSSAQTVASALKIPIYLDSHRDDPRRRARRADRRRRSPGSWRTCSGPT